MTYRIFKIAEEETAPYTLIGTMPFPTHWKDYQWFQELPKDTFYSLWFRRNTEEEHYKLPQGHSLYVISFHYEAIDYDWVMTQSKRIDAPLVIINDGEPYDFPWPENVHFFKFYSWHRHLDQLMQWFPTRQSRDLKYKLSCVCNRISQSKLIAATAILENFNREEILIKVGTWLQEKNVHDRQPTGVKKLDDLTEIFFSKYFGHEISIDDFNQKQNYHRINGNPWQPLYLESAIHINNESDHYSYMEDSLGKYTRPGPLLSEKTFKCLLSQTPFISVGQFDVYRQLSDLGLHFDYGDIDLNWDNDPGNLSRICGVVDTILRLKDYSINDIDEMTKHSSQHNADMIWSGEFTSRCEKHNESIAHSIIREFS